MNVFLIGVSVFGFVYGVGWSGDLSSLIRLRTSLAVWYRSRYLLFYLLFSDSDRSDGDIEEANGGILLMNELRLASFECSSYI